MGIEIFTDIYNKGSLANVLSKHIGFYRRHPDIAAYDLFNYDLVVHQRPVFRDMHMKQFVIDLETRGGSKTSKMALFGLTRGILYPGQRIGIIGPSFRQAKNVFDYAETMVEGAKPFVKDSISRFYRGTDSHKVEWRNEVGPGSMMEALPIGDGTKIRGARYFVILCDEPPHIPKDIHDMVIVPMTAVHINPAKRVREMARIKKLSPEDQEKAKHQMAIVDAVSGNKLIYCTTAYYQWNWFYDLYKVYIEKQSQGDMRYCVWEIPYQDVPDGFMNMETLNYSLATSPAAVFAMEYQCKWLADTDGFFPASLVESLQEKSGYNVILRSKRDHVYILAVDPASRIDYFAVIVIEIRDGVMKVVYADSIKGLTIPDMVAEIHKLDRDFGFSLITIDAGGGGNAVYDTLYTNEMDPWCEWEGISNPKGKDHNIKLGRFKGKKILVMTDFSSDWIEKANFSLKSSMEKRLILLPEPIRATAFPTSSSGVIAEEKVDVNIKTLKEQLISIEMHHTAGKGTLSFKPPKKNAHDDLYVAMLMAHKVAFDEYFSGSTSDADIENTVGFSEEFSYGGEDGEVITPFGIADREFNFGGYNG